MGSDLEARIITSTVEDCVRTILSCVGEDPDREGLRDTPARVARMYQELFSGLKEDPADHITKALFTAPSDAMVIERDIPFVSTCEHHLVPFVGQAHIGYVPGPWCQCNDTQDREVGCKENGQGHRVGYRITGLSKLTRVVDGFARRPQVQEVLTDQIAQCIQDTLKPRGVAVVIQAEHLCMSIRGVKKPGVKTLTASVRGIFETNQDGIKDEFMRLLTL